MDSICLRNNRFRNLPFWGISKLPEESPENCSFDNDFDDLTKGGDSLWEKFWVDIHQWQADMRLIQLLTTSCFF